MMAESGTYTLSQWVYFFPFPTSRVVFIHCSCFVAKQFLRVSQVRNIRRRLRMDIPKLETNARRQPSGI